MRFIRDIVVRATMGNVMDCLASRRLEAPPDSYVDDAFALSLVGHGCPWSVRAHGELPANGGGVRPALHSAL